MFSRPVGARARMLVSATMIGVLGGCVSPDAGPPSIAAPDGVGPAVDGARARVALGDVATAPGSLTVRVRVDDASHRLILAARETGFTLTLHHADGGTAGFGRSVHGDVHRGWVWSGNRRVRWPLFADVERPFTASPARLRTSSH